MDIKKSNFLVFILFFLGIGNVNGQFILKGKVVDAESFQPLEFATAFINNSTFGDITDGNGDFQIDIPSGNYELVISYLGYQTFSFPFNTANMRESYEFRILPEPLELEETQVSEKRDKTWYNNLKIFQEYFLGTSINGIRCRILNPEILILDNETDKNVLKARSKGILEIENPNLGYTVKYVLEGFELNLQNKVSRFAGYPYFIEEKLQKRRLEKVEKERERAYHGSIIHFIRSLFHDSMEENGFVVNRSELLPNPDRPSDKEIQEAIAKLSENTSFLEKQNLNNIIQKQSLPKDMESFSDELLSRNELIEKARNGFVFITYDQPFFVNYILEKEEPAYHESLVKQSYQILAVQTASLNYQFSKIQMTGKALRIFEDGSYFHPYDLYIEGYMAWERIGDMMPFNYGMKD
jgi:hypothetical protein